MKGLITVAFLFSLYAISIESSAQCRDFAKESGLKLLDTTQYVHDGRFNSIKLREGDEIELFKTISAGIKYRIVVCGSSELPVVPFEVLDFSRNVLFRSSDSKNAKTWDFEANSSQRLIISIKMPPPANTTQEPQSGCVAILFGLKQ